MKSWNEVTEIRLTQLRELVSAERSPRVREIIELLEKAGSVESVEYIIREYASRDNQLRSALYYQLGMRLWRHHVETGEVEEKWWRAFAVNAVYVDAAYTVREGNRAFNITAKSAYDAKTPEEAVAVLRSIAPADEVSVYTEH